MASSRPVQWLAGRDPGFGALRRAARTALVMPIMFAIGNEVIGNADTAVFAAFGSFAMLLLVDFGGPMHERLQAQLALVATGFVFIAVGTIASGTPWVAALAMLVVGFAVLFAGVVSSVLAGATTALVLAFILPVCLIGSASSIPARCLGWGMAGAAGLIAVAFLWPAPPRDTLRRPAVLACRALAHRLRLESAYLLGSDDAPSEAERDRAAADADGAVAALRKTFLATPYRPTGLSTPGRLVVRLVDELGWLNAVVRAEARRVPGSVNTATCHVKSAAARSLELSAALLERPETDPGELTQSLHELHEALIAMEARATVRLPQKQLGSLISSLEPSFRARELGFAARVVSQNIKLTSVAERRSWWERLLGRQPDGVQTPWQSAMERAGAHLERDSVWLHNSVRGAIGLGLAVYVANVTGVQHSFWVVLGTLSVLRSNALSTGQFAARGIAGTIAGFAVGGILVSVIGTNTAVLWALLPVAILMAGLAPAVVSFAAGQAAFTLTIVILFNIIQPAGWRVGLVRVEDVALGCAVSLVVGLLFWPRGASAALRRALASAYTECARYVARAADDMHPADPSAESLQASAASRRLDDAFRSYLAERGHKSATLADVTSLVTGVTALRLTGEALNDLWHHSAGTPRSSAGAKTELEAAGSRVERWYGTFGESLAGAAEVPPPLDHDTASDARLVAAVQTDLGDADGHVSDTALRLIWSADHLDVARRLQFTLVDPARTATRS